MLNSLMNSLFLFVHAAVIVFILTGWAWRRTRRAHLVLTGLTCFSWFGLGLFYGIGYCPFTDWQWRLKKAHGETNVAGSFVNYYLDRLTGRQWDPRLVGAVVMSIGVAALAASVVLNIRDRRQRGR